MLEKLDLGQIVRYLFSGTVAALSVCIARDIGLQELAGWRANNSWPSDTGLLTILMSTLLFTGYLLFTIYRGLVYELAILPLKAWVGKKLRLRSYREYISDLFERAGGSKLSAIEAERFYALVKLQDLKEVYSESGSQITTGLHFLFYSALVTLIGTLARFSALWPASMACVLALILAGLVDWHFEQLELLLFRSNEEKVNKTIESLVPKELRRSSTP